jgi:hypothetical protein
MTSLPAFYGKLLVTLFAQKLIRIGRDILPWATHSRRGGPCSPSREFGLALQQIQQAIEPHVSLKRTLYSWNQIAQALAEKSRKRRLQLAKWCSKADQTKHAAHLKPISMPSRSAVLARNFRVKPATRVKPNGGPVRTLFLIINTLAASAALATPRGERGPLCAADNRCEINPHCPEATMLIVAKS